MSRVVRTEVRERGAFGKLVKWTFILFNVLMLAWMLTTCASAGEMMNQAQSDAEQAGTAIGATVASGMLLFMWMAGVVILGALVLLTRGKKLIVEEVVE
jgi:NADH:ubiquinone oxidoreductase subunit 6 (subunit J)